MRRTPSHRLRAQTEEKEEKEEARWMPAFPPWVLVRREVNWQPHALITLSTTVHCYVLPRCDCPSLLWPTAPSNCELFQNPASPKLPPVGYFATKIRKVASTSAINPHLHLQLNPLPTWWTWPWWPSVTRLKKCLTVLRTAEHPAFPSPSHRRDKDSRARGKEVNPDNHFFTVSLQLIGILHAPFAFPHTLIYPVDVDSGLRVIIQCYLCIWAFLFLFHPF